MTESKKTILLVEDDAIIAASESLILGGEGFDVLRVFTGENAVETIRARGESIDLVLMDVDLGRGMDGTQAAQEILKVRDVPVLFISSHTEKEILVRAEKITSYGYVVKDSGDEVLLASVRMAFRLHDAQRALREKEETLRENEERFRLVALNSPDHIFYQDADLRYTWVANPSSHLATSLRAGKTDKDFFGEAEGERISAIKRNVIATGISARIETYLLRDDGSRRLYEGFYAPRRDAAGRIVGLTGYARDISERERMEEALDESHRNFRLLADNISDVIFALDLSLRFTYVSPSMERVLGYTAAEAMARPPREFLKGRSEEKVQELFGVLTAALNAGEANPSTTAEMELVHRDGRVLWAEVRVTLIPDGNSRTARIVGIARDVTERKRIALSLQESEARFHAMADTAPVLIWVTGEDKKVTYFNKPWLEFTGRSLQEEIGDGWLAGVHPEDRAVVESSYLNGREAGVAYSVEYRLRRRDGEYRWFIDNGTPRIHPDGSVAGYIGSCTDITDRKLAEEKLALSERQHRSLVERMNEGLMQVNNDDVITFVNRQLCDLTGYTREELLGQTGNALLFDSGDRQIIMDYNRRRVAGRSDVYELRLKKKGGEKIWMQISGSPVDNAKGEVVGSIGVVRDITERKLTEEALRRSEEKFRGIFENAPLGIFQTTFEGKLLGANATALRMFGYGPEDVASSGNDNIVPALFLDPARREAIIRGALAADSFSGGEVDYRRKNGSIFRAYLSMRAVRGPAGEPLMLEGFVEDITERRRLESIMRESEERLREITDNMMDMVIRVDEDGTFRYVSPSHERILGFRPGELLGTPAPDLIHPDDRDAVVAKLTEIVRAGNGTLSFRSRHKNGEYRWLESLGRSVMNEKGEYIGAVIGSRDITDRHIAEEQLRDSLKEKEILVKEVLHRVKNNLSLVASLLNLQSGYVVAPKDADLFKEARDRIIALARIHENLYRSRNLAHVDFRTYAADIVRNLSDAYRNDGVETRLDISPFEIGLDRAIPLGLIINELVTNCLKYAFPSGRGGEIVVSYRKTEGGGDELSVSDNGVGIPPALDVANPGTFGLSLVNLLVEQINAALEVRRGNGTEFVVRFPR